MSEKDGGAAFPVAINVVPKAASGMMPHEHIASGDLDGLHFDVIRDLTGLHWQVKAGDLTAAFSLNDLIEHAVKEIATRTEAPHDH